MDKYQLGVDIACILLHEIIFYVSFQESEPDSNGCQVAIGNKISCPDMKLDLNFKYAY